MSAQDKLDLLFRSEKILGEGDTIRALAAFSETLRLFPQSYAAAMRLAEITSSRKDFKKAIQYCNVALDITDNFIASTEASMKTLGMALDSSRRYRQFVTDQAYMHYLKGNIRMNQSRNLDAEHEYRRAKILDPNNANIPVALSALLFNIGRVEEAKTEVKIALTIDPTHYKGRLQLSSLYQSTGRTDSAIYHLNQLVAVHNSSAYPNLLLGNIYAEKGEQELAARHYASYIKLDSTSAEVYYRRAVIYTDLQQWNEALADWTKSINIVPHEDTYRNRGLTYFKMNELEKAIDDFDVALQLAPDQPYTKVNRGYSYYLMGKDKKALNDLEEGLKIVPKYYLGHYFKAMVYLSMRKKKKACLALNEAIELGLPDADIDQHLLKKCF